MIQTLSRTMDPAIVCIIPTYNEPEDLASVVRSIQAQDVPHVTVLVVNAGDPLPEDLARQVTELKVPDDHFWTHCIQDGFEWAKSRSFDYVLMTNADTQLMPGTLRALLTYAQAHPSTVAVAPAYIIGENEEIRLLYSHQSDWGPLLYGKLIRPWVRPEDAPNEPFEIDLTGGQGVLFEAKWLQRYQMDDINFPHYASDHDLWLQMRHDGIKMMLVPEGGIVNQRVLSRMRKGGLVKTLWHRMTSDMTPESYKIMWRLRRKHLSLPVAIPSFLVSFGLRWTLGLPKIVRRS